MVCKHLSFKNVLLYILLPIIIVFGILEVWMRVTLDKYHATHHVENKYYAQLAESLENKDEHFESLYKITKNGFSYYDYHLYALAPLKTSTITITDYYSARFVPESVSIKKANEVVWFFGGSTLQNLGSPDDVTIVNTATQYLKQKGIKAHVRNFAVGGHQSSLEMIKFMDLLRRVPKDERPTMAVFYDGFNDVWYGLEDGAGNYQGDIRRKISDLVTKSYNQFGLLFTINNALHDRSIFWQKRIYPVVFRWLKGESHILKAKDENHREANINKIVDTYVHNLNMINSVCNAYAIDCVFMLQPMLHSKKPLTESEEQIKKMMHPLYIQVYEYFYKKVKALAKNVPNFVDLSGILNNRKQVDFYDYGHTAPYTSPVIGVHVGQQLLKQINLRTIKN